MKDWLQMIVPLIVAAMAAFTAGQQFSNGRLKKKLRRYLLDCMAFYQLEEMYCKSLADDSRTANSVKRTYRAALRDLGEQSPSEDATPKRMQEELEKL